MAKHFDNDADAANAADRERPRSTARPVSPALADAERARAATQRENPILDADLQDDDSEPENGSESPKPRRKARRSVKK